MCPRESSSVGYNAISSEKRWHGHNFSYVVSTCDCFWCVIIFWFIPLVNFDSLITSRNFPASPRILETVWHPQADHPENHCSPQKTIFLKLRSDLVASKFNHKISMKVTKFISSGLRVDRWMFQKIIIVSNYFTLLESYDGFKKCITCSGAPCSSTHKNWNPLIHSFIHSFIRTKTISRKVFTKVPSVQQIKIQLL